MKYVKDIIKEAHTRADARSLFDSVRTCGTFVDDDAAIIVEDLEIGDFFMHSKEGVLVYCGDGVFRFADAHSQNPWKEGKGFGYHLKKIEKRRYGSLGKIQEETEELLDAHRQGSHIMMLVELSDLYGAIEGFLEENYPTMKMTDLKKFSDITKRAFKEGART